MKGDVHPTFTSVLHAAAARMPTPESGVPYALFNPSLVAHGGEHLLLTRISTNTHCHGGVNLDIDLYWHHFKSAVSICRMTVPAENGWPSFPRNAFSACWEPDVDLAQLLQSSPYTYSGSGTFQRLEDARGLSLRGKLYLLGSVVVGLPHGRPA